MNTPPLDPLGQMIAKYQSNGHQPPAATQSPTAVIQSSTTQPPAAIQPPSTIQLPTIPKQPRRVLERELGGKTLWDWLNLIGVLLVPLMIGVLTIATTIQQSQISQQQFKLSIDLSKSQHDSDQAIATDQQQATALKSYMDDMTDLLLHQGLRQSKLYGDEVRIVARAKTLTTLRGLNGDRKGALLQFLYEAELIGGFPPSEASPYPAIVSLNGADLNGVILSNSGLSGADLGGTDLNNANLSNTNLRYTGLSNADLNNANLSNTNLSNTNLNGADLNGANLRGADLSNADLRWANLTNAIVTPEQLAQAYSLKSATLPNGSKYPSKTYPIPKP